MGSVVVDTSALLDYLVDQHIATLEFATASGSLRLPPLVVAEVFSGDLDLQQREAFADLLQDYPIIATPLEHWMNVGFLRRTLRIKGVNVTLPDAHVAQCALDLDAALLTRDEVFTHIAKHTALRLR